MTQNPKLTISIATHGNRPIAETLNCVERSIVASGEAVTIHVVRDLPLAMARNRGIDECRTDLLCFLDDDTRPRIQFVSAVLAWHRHNPAVNRGCVAEIVWPAEKQCTDFEKMMGPLGSPTWRPENFFSTPFQFYGASLTFKRQFISESLRFDEAFSGWGCEDTEWAYRLHRAGASFECLPSDPSTVVEHHTKLDRVKWLERTMNSAANVLRFAEKYPTDPTLIRWVGKGAAIVSDPKLQISGSMKLHCAQKEGRGNTVEWQRAAYSFWLACGLAPLMRGRVAELPAAWFNQEHHDRLVSELRACES